MYKKTTLDNGLRIVTHDMKQRDSISLGFWVGAGGRYEDDRIKGAAHFLEHILFKGSKKYSCEAIKEKIEGVGGMLNAFTSEEQTCYYAKIPSIHLNKTFDVLADMVFHPQINPKDVAKESTVIIEEIKMYRDLPQYQVLEFMDGLLWPNHPLGKNLAGTKESVSAMTNQDLRNFHNHFYNPANIVVAACGQLKHEDVVDLVKKKLGTLKQGRKESYLAADNSQSVPRTHLFRRATEQMHLALGMLGYHEDHPDRYALSLLSIILGGNMSSRLFVEIREKRGLAYSISSTTKSMHDTGLFMIRAGVDNQKLIETVTVVLKELAKIRKSPVSADEFLRGKDYLLGQLLLGLEDTMDHMLWLGEAVVSKNKLETLESIIEKFNKIKIKDVERVAGEILNPKRFNLAVVGPLVDSQEKQLRDLLN